MTDGPSSPRFGMSDPVADPVVVTDHAISTDASSEEVWP